MDIRLSKTHPIYMGEEFRNSNSCAKRPLYFFSRVRNSFIKISTVYPCAQSRKFKLEPSYDLARWLVVFRRGDVKSRSQGWGKDLLLPKNGVWIELLRHSMSSTQYGKVKEM